VFLWAILMLFVEELTDFTRALLHLFCMLQNCPLSPVLETTAAAKVSLEKQSNGTNKRRKIKA